MKDKLLQIKTLFFFLKSFKDFKPWCSFGFHIQSLNAETVVYDFIILTCSNLVYTLFFLALSQFLCGPISPKQTHTDNHWTSPGEKSNHLNSVTESAERWWRSVAAEHVSETLNNHQIDSKRRFCPSLRVKEWKLLFFPPEANNWKHQVRTCCQDTVERPSGRWND